MQPEAHAHTQYIPLTLFDECYSAAGPSVASPSRSPVSHRLASTSASEHSPLQTPSERAAVHDRVVARSSWLGFRCVVQDGARAIVVQDGPIGSFVER
eukprot:scaffold50794_cov68-Phaeocystis_antarctica.AAC.4